MMSDTMTAPLTNIEFHLLLSGERFTECYEAMIEDIETFWKLDEGMYRRFGDLCAQMVGDEALLASLEFYHVDSSYRSAYYAHYARRHFDVPRWTIRIAFFDPITLFSGGDRHRFFKDERALERALGFTVDDWVMMPTNLLQKAFLGSTVLCPTRLTHLGKTLVDPSRMATLPNGSDSDRALIRLSTFEQNIAGKKLRVRAFPFYDQDHDLMSCAEVTILSLMRYYTNEFHGYVDVEPADILESERQTAYSRLVPTTGLAYPDLCSVLKGYGFQPELYENTSVGRRWQRPLPEGWAFRRLLHTYLESGIPTAVNVAPPGDSFTGHSLVCVGRTGTISDLDGAIGESVVLDVVSCQTSDMDHPELVRPAVGCRVIHAADLHREYVVIDDNQLPYAIRDIDHLSLHEGMRNARLVAPLKLGMTVDAGDAQFIFEKLMSDVHQGLLKWAGRWFAGCEGDMESADDGKKVRVVMRTFLASSKRFKTYRVATVSRTCGSVRAQAYASTPLPHYVWVCEFLLLSEYEKFTQTPGMHADGHTPLDGWSAEELRSLPQAFCEYVVDATSGPTNVGAGALVMTHFPKYLGVRSPDSTRYELDQWPGVVGEDSGLVGNSDFQGFPCYMENLDSVVLSG